MYQIVVIPILLACIGAAIALAKILLTEDPLKPRIVAGRIARQLILDAQTKEQVEAIQL